MCIHINMVVMWEGLPPVTVLGEMDRKSLTEEPVAAEKDLN